MPMLLETLGCEVHRIHCEPSGEFVRGTEPLPENLGDLCQAVQDFGADVGMAVDPDCDRLAVVDNSGKPLGEEYTLVLAVDGYLAYTGSDEAIVTNMSTTLALDKIAEKYGNPVVRTPIGEINVVAEMEKSGVKLGGEGNGGVILRESHLGRDALVGAALVLNRMVQSEQTLSEIFSGLPQFTIIKDKINLEELDFEQVYKKALAVFTDVLVDDRDGLKFIWPERWLHIRKSNTEPILRIYAEATDIVTAEALIKTLKSAIN
jgi:phosphomannomutase